MSDASDTIHVLHVDDEPSLSEMVATFLEREDSRIEVRTTTSPDEGLDILAEHDVDCVVSDYDMPHTNGIEFLGTVRERYPELPFILYTGKGSEEVASEAISAGVTNYLQKDGGTDQYAILANRITNAVAGTRAEREVERTREYFGTILEHASDYVMVVNESGQVDYISPAVERVMGYAPDDLGGADAFERIHPDDRSKASGAFARLLDQPDQEHAVEYRARHANGSWRWLEVRGRNLLDDPVIEGILVSVRDVTERKARKRERRRKERRYHAVFNDPNILVGLIDPDGTVLDINQTAMDYVDVTLDEVTGELFWDTPWFHHSEDVQQEVKDWIDRAASGEYVEFEADLVRPDGDPYTVEGVFRPVTNDDGEVVSLLISDRDVTERKDRERELIHAKRRLDLALQEARAGIWEWNLDTGELYWSDELLDLLGVSVEEFDGEIDAFEERLHPDDVDRVEATMENAMETGGHYQVEQRLENSDGEYLWFDVRGQVVENSDPPSMIGIGIDVTERKEQEARLHRQRDRLERFASVVSHDLRNPLQVADGRLELARGECASEHLDAIETALDRMDRIIEDVLWLAREGQDIGSVEPVAVRETVDATWDLVADGSDRAELRYPDDELATATIMADDDRFRQLLENLFRNAIEHGGEDVTVTVGTSEDGLYVEDDGPGIPPDQCDDVFDAGYSTADEGTGFGLRIVKQVAEAHDWEIRVTAGDDGGARFEISGVEFVAE